MVNVSRSAGRRDRTADTTIDSEQDSHHHSRVLATTSNNLAKAPSPSSDHHRAKRRRLDSPEDTPLLLSPSQHSKDTASRSAVVELARRNGKRARVVVDEHSHAKTKKQRSDIDTNAQIHEPQQINTEKRVLRSAAGTSHSESELAYFFPDYEEYVFGPTQPSRKYTR